MDLAPSILGGILALHIVAVTIFGGAVFATAVRLLGIGFRSYSPIELRAGLRGVKGISFLFAASSGLLLFVAAPAQYAADPWFLAKIVLLVLAGVTDLRFRSAGALSLLLWSAAAFAGRGPATIKDIMHSMVDPTGDAVFASVQEISDMRGIHEKAPRTAADWQEVRRQLQILEKASYLITAPRRKAAHPVDRSRNPGVEEQPESVQHLLDADRPALMRRARRLRDAAAIAIQAVDRKDKDALLHDIDGIDKACENCHLHYWYPNDKRAQQAAIEDGVADE